MKKHVVVYKPLPIDLRDRLAGHFALTEFAGVGESDRDAFAAALATAHGAIGTGVKFDAQRLAGAPHLEAVATASVGYDVFDVPALTQRGIVLMNTPGVLDETVADAIFALMLASARRVVELAEYVKANRWRASVDETYFGTDVHGKTLGIIGMGRIGVAVARRAALGFGMPVLYANRSRNEAAERTLGARYCSQDELLATSDFVCVMVPLTPQTDRMIGAAQLARMKPGAILINASRGRVIDEAALIDALRQRRIRGAGLDVFEREPLPADSPLLALDNVVALPHIGSATHETRHAMAACAVDNLIAALNRRPGEILRNVVNPEVLK